MNERDPVHIDLPLQPTGVRVFTTPRRKPNLYPGTRPSWSFCFVGDRILPILPSREGLKILEDGSSPEDLETFVRRLRGSGLGDLLAILAVGSNACPARLADPDKYGSAQSVAIPVLRGWVDGVVSVYCPRTASYGSVPATIAGLPGVRTRLWVTLLNSQELRRMDESEGRGERYQLLEIPHARLHLEGGISVGPLSAYYESAGLVAPDSDLPIRLACFDTTDTLLPMMHQGEAQTYAESMARQHNDSKRTLPSIGLDLPFGARVLPTGDLPRERVRFSRDEREEIW